MRSKKVRVADRRLPKSIQALRNSDERLKRERANTMAQLNHDDDPVIETEAPPIFRAKETAPVPVEPPMLALDDQTLRISATNACLIGSAFRDVNLRGVEVADANLSGAYFRDVNLTGVVIEDAAIDGLTINGISVADAIAALAASALSPSDGGKITSGEDS